MTGHLDGRMPVHELSNVSIAPQFTDQDFQSSPLSPDRMHFALHKGLDTKSVFISIDLEMYERKTNLITEIGICILEWVPAHRPVIPNIKAIHMIPTENQGYRNGKFVAEKRDYFTHGQSFVQPMKECRETYDNIIKHYLEQRQCAKIAHIFFVGHDFKGDVRVLEGSGFSVPKSIPVLDTSKLYTQVTQVKEQISLGNLLLKLNRQHRYLHNAGNDAYATLEALLSFRDLSPERRAELREVAQHEAAARKLEQERNRELREQEREKSKGMGRKSKLANQKRDMPASVVENANHKLVLTSVYDQGFVLKR